MRNTLIVLATASVLASGGAAAGNPSNHGSATFVPVQHSPYSDRRDDRWDDHSMNVNEREARINARIQRGLRDGRITDREGRRLYRELAAIEAKERSFLADGRLNFREEAELKRNLDRLADNVRVQLRDEDRVSYYAR